MDLWILRLIVRLGLLYVLPLWLFVPSVGSSTPRTRFKRMPRHETEGSVVSSYLIQKWPVLQHLFSNGRRVGGNIARSYRRPMSQPMIILYDVPSSIPHPWAPNIWRIRLILNYKRLPYRTCWVEFPDIERTLRAIGAPPTSIRPDGQPVYALPAIFDPIHASSIYPDPSGAFSRPRPVVLTHPNTIAEHLEHAYPARPVIPEGTRALQFLFVHYITDVFVQPLLHIMIPLSHQRLPPHVQRHFPFDGVGHGHDRHSAAVPHTAREAQWAVVRGQFAFLASMLDKNAGDGDGVVVMGHELTYADFAICSILIWIEKIAPHEGWARVRDWDGGRWRRLWERCEGYMDVF